jgi:fatty acid-binding protein DegV
MSTEISRKNQILLGMASTRQEAVETEQPLPVSPQRSADPYGVVMVDAAADISGAMAQHPRLRMLPLEVQLPDRKLVDRGARALREAAGRIGREHLRRASIAMPDVAGLEYRLYPNLALNADHLIYLGSMGALGAATTGLQTLLHTHRDEIRELRRARGLADQLQLTCVDTRSLLAGPALQARLLLKRLDSGEPAAQVAQAALGLPQQTQLWVVPRYPAEAAGTLARLDDRGFKPWIEACGGSLRHFWNAFPVLAADAGGASCTARARTWQAAVEQVFAALREQLQGARPRSCAVLISYDGGIRELQSWPEFMQLAALAARLQMRLHVTHMSLVGRVCASSESLSVALLRQSAA